MSDDVLDTALMDGLEARFGRDIFESLVQEYLGEVKGRIARIEQATAANDLAGLRKEVHDLTTSSGTIGIRLVYEAAQACEFACRDEDVEQAMAIGREMPGKSAVANEALLVRYPSLAG